MRIVSPSANHVEKLGIMLYGGRIAGVDEWVDKTGERLEEPFLCAVGCYAWNCLIKLNSEVVIYAGHEQRRPVVAISGCSLATGESVDVRMAF